MLLPLTGRHSGLAEQAMEGATLAAEGTGLELVVSDTGADIYTAIRSARELVEDEGVGSIVGPLLSDPTVGAAAVTSALSVPLITPTATDERIAEISDLVLQVNASIADQGRRMAAYAGQALLCRRVAIVHRISRYGETISLAFREAFERAGGEVVGVDTYPLGTSDFQPIVLRLAELNVDGIYLPLPAEDVVQIAPVLLYHDVHAALLGAHGWSEDTVRDLGDQYVGGAVFSTTFLADSHDPATRHFVTRYLARFEREPDVVAAATYDAVRLVVHAARDGLSPEDLQPGKGNDFRGVMGTWGPEGVGTRLVTIHDEKFYAVAPLASEPPFIGAAPIDSMADSLGGFDFGDSTVVAPLDLSSVEGI